MSKQANHNDDDDDEEEEEQEEVGSKSDARSDATLSGSSAHGSTNDGENRKNDVFARRTQAMGEAMHRLYQGLSEEGKEGVMSRPFALGGGFEKMEAQNQADIESLSQEAQELLVELGGLLETERFYQLSDGERKKLKKQDVVRAREILSNHPEVNPNIKVLPYGEALLTASVNHSVDMLKLLLEHGADPNIEDDMGGETAYDKVEEYLEEGIEVELKEMQKALVAAGAVCFEERMANL